MKEELLVKFDKGPIPAIIQDARTGQVLMLGYVNEEALKLTLETKEVWFYSRSRGCLWHKGESSGSILKLKEALVDCDGDALLFKVEPQGPVCHTGNFSCFFQELAEA